VAQTWEQLSRNCLSAAEALLREGHYRSSVSRAYYAAYCAATHEIVQKLTTFSHGWKNPSHEMVPNYVLYNLTISQTKKDIISTLINILRLYREDADYRPQIIVDEATARECVRAASEVLQEFWGAI
jgi:uncharacterized protein (UPF0332 family)